ncbi:hypothetical protein [Dyella acidisoli]|uniref:6-bladed beta-propeller n=1 Tax=Dyella acidisoli TaxID=1867834 RepID=A0ABQ5XQ65_9GAMM|nr:hypothetical protein [Dyella acidisoli]GLQ93522.1 hypothetical protein GCM10007901_24730 [Dyella acidisoli]
MFPRVFLSKVRTKAFQLLTATVLIGAGVASQAGYCSDVNNPNANFFISSFGSNQLMMFSETGAFLKVVYPMDGPVASQIGFDGDLFVSANLGGQVLRFDGFTGAYKGVFIDKGVGGLTNPSAPNFGPDNLVYVGDAATNRVLRYDRHGNFIDIFAGPGSRWDSPNYPALSGPFMNTFDDKYMYIASANNNSVIRYDLKTGEPSYFVPPGSGGLKGPIGLEIGPDGNFYVTSTDNRVLRYKQGTGEFMDAFIPAGSGGLSVPRAVRFSGPNSNLYIISLGTDQVLEFDRETGAFVRVVANGAPYGLSTAKGLTLTPTPIFNVYAKVDDHAPFLGVSNFKHVCIEHSLQDYSDPSPQVKLVSIVSTDTSLDMTKAVRNAHFGQADYGFDLDFSNSTGADQHYTIEYIATNNHGLTKIATTEVDVPPQQ